VRYTITEVYNNPNEDLTICKVDGTFSSYAPLYTGSDEVGKLAMIFGKGAPRGNEVVNGSTRGWEWGSGSWNTLRWGTNEITSIVDSGGSTWGHLLGAEFNHNAGVNEGMLSGGDSGFGLFILDAGVWKLAGVNSCVDGPYSLQANFSNAFNAALYNEDGYYGDYFTGIVPMSGSGMFYTARVSSSMGWIQDIAAVPEPSVWCLLLFGCPVLYACRRKFAR